MRLADLMQYVEPLSPSDIGESAFARFQREPDLLLIPVTDAEKVVGVLRRQTFLLRFGSEYGRALFARRAVGCLVEPIPNLLEASTEIDTLLPFFRISPSNEVLDGLIIIDSQKYCGIVSMAVLMCAGMTLLQDRGEALEVARTKAEQANMAKSAFLSQMSHEIRTPLNAIIAGLAVLERAALPPDVTDLLATMSGSGRLLHRLLTDALDTVQVETGRFTIVVADFSPKSFAESLASTWLPLAQERGLALKLKVSVEAGLVLRGDLARMAQIANNLISNAIKFTSDGEVLIECSATYEPNGAFCFQINVIDTGPGIETDLAHRLFQPYTQGHAAKSCAWVGSGLGLSISQSLAKAMGGEVSYQPRPDRRGSCFSFTIPLEHADALPVNLESAESQDAPALRVLIVDDNRANRVVLSRLLGIFGHAHVLAESGEQGIALAEATDFDVILMDLRMPGMDGIEATRRIRAGEGVNRLTPIIGLTAETDETVLARLVAAGANGILEKPIDTQALLSALNELAPSKCTMLPLRVA